jgi:hypothetical protein
MLLTLLLAGLVLYLLWPSRRESAFLLSSPSALKDARPTQSGGAASTRSGSLPGGGGPSALPSPSGAGAVPNAGGNPLASFQRLVELGQAASAHDAIRDNAAKAKQYVKRFCEETAKLRVDGGVPNALTQGANDAAAFMNSQIDYSKPLDNPPGLLHLPDAFLERIRSYGAAWPEKVTAADLQGLDVSWLAQLQQYDSWSVTSSGPLADYPVGDPLYAPLPTYDSLIVRAKLRYALALARGDVGQASAEVLHLAELMRGQGLWISELMAIQLYRIDGEARAAASSVGMDVASWTPLDPSLRASWREMAMASRLFTLPDVSPEVMRQALDCMPSACPAIIEGVSMGKALAVYGESDNVRQLVGLGAEHGCDSGLLSRLAAADTASPYEALDVLHDDLAAYFPPRQ